MKVLALNNDGMLTYCSVPADMRGIGRCNHVVHQEENETPEQFKMRVGSFINNKDKVIEKSYDALDCYIQEVKNYDEKKKLFKKTQNGYKTTEYADYIVFSQAKLFFAAKIVELDKKCQYHSESFADVYDEEAYIEGRKEYQEQFNQLDKFKENYKIKHPEQFEEAQRVETPQHFIKDYKCKQKFTLEQCIQGYKYASESLKRIDNSKLPKYTIVQIKPEFKEQYQEEVRIKRDNLGIPTEDYFKSLGTKTEKRTRLKLNRQSSESNEQNKIYMQDICSYMASL